MGLLFQLFLITIKKPNERKKATEIFSQWVLDGKDEGMEKNHSDAVNVMLDEIIGSQTDPFSIIDAGCGNGWVVRKINNHPCV